MPPTPDEQRLLRVSKAERRVLASYREGVSIEVATGRTIEQLRHQASADRLTLASGFLHAADRMIRMRPPMYRISVGRYYYAMYHTMRAVAYFRYGGDDYEQHSILPTKTPSDFTTTAYWENELKDARLRRNEADYDPYPTRDSEFKQIALHLRTQAHDLVREATVYLRSKGCDHV